MAITHRILLFWIVAAFWVLPRSVSAGQEPVLEEIAKTLKEDKSTVIALKGKSPVGKKLSYSIVNQPQYGSVTLKGNKVKYTPRANYFGPDEFQYQASDGGLNSSPANVKLAILPVNDRPIAIEKTIDVGNVTASTIPLTATDIEGDALSYKILSKPKKGVATVRGNLVSYTPSKVNYEGTDAFKFGVNDGKLNSNPAKVNIKINYIPLRTISGVVKLGAVSGATISIFESSNLQQPISTTVTNLYDSDGVGSFEFKNIGVFEDRYYVIKATGGLDIDSFDGGGINIDSAVELKGGVYSIISGKDLVDGFGRVNVLSDMVFMHVKDSLQTMASDELNGFLERQASNFLGDINKDGSINYQDILYFDPEIHKAESKISYTEIKNKYISEIHNNTDRNAMMRTLLYLEKPVINIAEGAFRKVPFHLTAGLSYEYPGLTVDYFVDGRKAQELDFEVANQGNYFLQAAVKNLSGDILYTATKSLVGYVSESVNQFKTSDGVDAEIYVMPDGSSDLNGLKVLIPDASLNQGEAVEVKMSTSSLMPDTLGYRASDVFIMEPSGTVFEKPISISIPVDTKDISNIDELIVARLSADGKIDYIKPAYIDFDSDSVVFYTDHFSAFQLKKTVFGGIASDAQAIIDDLNSLVGSQISISNQEWEKILNQDLVNDSYLTVYDLYLEYVESKKIHDFVDQRQYAAAIRILFPDYSALDKRQEMWNVYKELLESLDSLSGARDTAKSAMSIISGTGLQKLKEVVGFFYPVDISGVDQVFYDPIDIGDKIFKKLLDLDQNHKIGMFFDYLDQPEFVQYIDDAFNEEQKKLIRKVYIKNKLFNSNASRDKLVEVINEYHQAILDELNPRLVMESDFLKSDSPKLIAGTSYNVNFKVDVFGLSVADNNVKITVTEKIWGGDERVVQTKSVQVGGYESISILLPNLNKSSYVTYRIKAVLSSHKINGGQIELNSEHFRTVDIDPQHQIYGKDFKILDSYLNEYSGDFCFRPSFSFFDQSGNALHPKYFINTSSTRGYFNKAIYPADINKDDFCVTSSELNNSAVFNDLGSVVFSASILDDGYSQNISQVSETVNLVAEFNRLSDSVLRDTRIEVYTINNQPVGMLQRLNPQLKVNDKVQFIVPTIFIDKIDILNIDGNLIQPQLLPPKWVMNTTNGPYNVYEVNFAKAINDYTPWMRVKFKTGQIGTIKGNRITFVDNDAQPPIQPESPVIAINNVSVTPATLATGELITVSATLTNTSSVASTIGKLFYYTSKTNMQQFCADVPVINPSQIVNINCSVTAPTAPGIYNFGVCYGDYCSNGYSVNVTNPTFKSVSFISETAPYDYAVVQRGGSFTKTWTFKNNGNVDLSSLEVVSVSQQGNLSPTVSSNVPSILPVGSNFSYSLNFTIPKNAPAGVYKGQYKIHDPSDTALSQVFWYAFNVPQPQAFEGALYPSATELVKNDPLTLGIKINKGEAPYQVNILWGDGSSSLINSVANDVIESAVKNYSATGIYTIEVQIADSMGQTITLTTPLKVTDLPANATTWQGSGQDLDTSESNPSIPIAITSTSPYSYKIDWKPQGSAVNYFTKYRLAVPSGLMSLSKKMRLTVASKGFFISDYDRALTLVSNTGKHYTSAILAGTPGFTRYLDINSGLENKTFTASLQDSGIGLAISDRLYALELNPDSKQRTYLYQNNQYTQLYANDITLDSAESLSQIDISFKGIGQIDLALLDYDKNGNGSYEDNERIILTTSSGTVIWDQTQTNNLDFKGFGPLSSALLSPNGGETLISGVSNNITWDPNQIQGATVSIYVLHDDPSTLKNCPTTDANDLLNCKTWYLMQSSVPNTGSLVFDPANMNGSGNAYIVLIVSDYNPLQWDVSDTTFTLTSNNLVSFIKLNDTGITTCSNAASNGVVCPVAGFPGQDAESGRDVTHNDDSDGHAGFSFTKLDSNGNPLAASASQWDCVKDNVTGLIWEVKTTSGLRSMSNSYTWYEPDSSKNGGNAGSQNGGTCTGSNCDTYSYVQAVNAQGLCGASDWRMPSRKELLSIVDNSKAYPEPTIDTNYFPNTPASFVWSSSPYANSSGHAWGVDFHDGHVHYGPKASYSHVRLVRGGQ